MTTGEKSILRTMDRCKDVFSPLYLIILACQTRLLRGPGVNTDPHAQEGPRASVPSSWLSNGGLLWPNLNSVGLALVVG